MSAPNTALCMMIYETGGAPDTVVTVSLSAPVTGAAVAVDVTALTTKRITAGTSSAPPTTPS
ncbi:hypothetical protein [Streptomyces sp. 7N604]|uniref:hypothetical protein n=1 Tax=Streptomyces sp. 7N604 TaxID=3457415 RepID=UPI003FD36D05